MTPIAKFTQLRDVEWLRERYENDELSTQDIADIVGCTRKNVEYWMKKFGIDRRNNITCRTARFRQKISETSLCRPSFSKGLTKHSHPSLQKISEKVSGDKSPAWKGGRTVNVQGYALVWDPEHPNRDKSNYVLEHRLVMEFLLGRLLESHEIVHHRDGNRANNLSSNLFLFPNNRAHLWFHTHKFHKDPLISEEEFMEDVFYEAS